MHFKTSSSDNIVDEKSDFADFVGFVCEKCNELFQRKDLEDHKKVCLGFRDSESESDDSDESTKPGKNRNISVILNFKIKSYLEKNGWRQIVAVNDQHRKTHQKTI